MAMRTAHTHGTGGVSRRRLAICIRFCTAVCAVRCRRSSTHSSTSPILDQLCEHRTTAEYASFCLDCFLLCAALHSLLHSLLHCFTASLLHCFTHCCGGGGAVSAGSTLEWPAYNTQTSQSMYLQTPQSTIVTNFLDDYCSFWDDIGYGY